MNGLAAIFVAGVGLYTIAHGPRSWPHWLAGCAALGFAFVDRVFPFEASGRGVGFTLVAALCLSAAAYLVNGSARNLRWVALTLIIGVLPTLLNPFGNDLPDGKFQNLTCFVVGAIFLALLFAPKRYGKLSNYIAAFLSVFFLSAILDDFGFLLIYSSLYFISFWGSALLIFSEPKYIQRVEISFWRASLVSMAAGFVLAMLEFRENFVFDDVSDSRFPPSFPDNNPALTELSAWLAPLLVAVGIVATCFAVVRLVPRQPNPTLEAAEPSNQTNPL